MYYVASTIFPARDAQVSRLILTDADREEYEGEEDDRRSEDEKKVRPV